MNKIENCLTMVTTPMTNDLVMATLVSTILENMEVIRLRIEGNTYIYQPTWDRYGCNRGRDRGTGRLLFGRGR